VSKANNLKLRLALQKKETKEKWQRQLEEKAERERIERELLAHIRWQRNKMLARKICLFLLHVVTGACLALSIIYFLINCL